MFVFVSYNNPWTLSPTRSSKYDRRDLVNNKPEFLFFVLLIFSISLHTPYSIVELGIRCQVSKIKLSLVMKHPEPAYSLPEEMNLECFFKRDWLLASVIVSMKTDHWWSIPGLTSVYHFERTTNDQTNRLDRWCILMNRSLGHYNYKNNSYIHFLHLFHG